MTTSALPDPNDRSSTCTAREMYAHVLLDGQPKTRAELASDSTTGLCSDRLLYYGEGFFDSFLVHKAHLYRPDAHLERLGAGMDLLSLEVPDDLRSEQAFLQALAGLLRLNHAEHERVRVRIQVWAQDQTVGYRPAPGRRRARWLATCARPGNTMPVRLHTSRYRRVSRSAVPPHVKWSGAVNYVLAAAEAGAAGADDALMLSHQGYVSESTIANIFWLANDIVYTPDEQCDLLPGIARGAVLKSLQQLGVAVNTGQFDPGVLPGAEMVWLSNSVRGIYPVEAIDAHTYTPSQPFWNRLLEAFQAHVRREEHRVV